MPARAPAARCRRSTRRTPRVSPPVKCSRSSLSDLNGQSTHAGLHNAASAAADGAARSRRRKPPRFIRRRCRLCVSSSICLRPASFAGPAKRGPARNSDWTIEQDGDEWDRSGGGTASEEDQPWRTRLTLSLPTLGTVDAELTLTGMRLVARAGKSGRRGAACDAGRGLSSAARGGGHPVARVDDSRDRRRRACDGARRRRALRRPLRQRRRRMRDRPRRARGGLRRLRANAAAEKSRRAPLDDFDWDM